MTALDGAPGSSLPALITGGPSPLQQLPLVFAARGHRRAVGLRGDLAIRWWSYRDLADRVLQVAAALRSLGIGRGDRIGLWAQNSPEWVALLCGALVRAVVVVPVDATTRPDEVAALMDQAGAGILFVGNDRDAAALASWGGRVLSLASVIDGAPGAPGVPALADVVVEAAAGDSAVLLFTSGTTLASKRVLLTHGNILSQVAEFTRWRRFVNWVPTRMMSLSPLSHVQGLVLGMLVPLSVGVSVIYSTRVDPAHVIRIIRAHGPTLLLAVPRIQHLLVEALRQLPAGNKGRTVADEERIAWFPLRRHRLFLATRRALGLRFAVVLVGGAALAPEDERFWFNAGYVLVQGYGLTETSALVSYAVNHPFRWRGGSIGRALSGISLAVADDGELMVRGAGVAGGESSADGYFHTGDLVSRDDSGRLFFTGRKKNLIVTAEGENVSALAVEQAVTAVRGVRDAVALGVSRAGHEEVHAVFLLAEGTRAEDVVAEANARLSRQEKIAGWTVWPEADFPRGSLGKPRLPPIVSFVEEAGRAVTLAGRRESPNVAAVAGVEVEDDRLLPLEEIRRLPSREDRVLHLARLIVAGDESAAGLNAALLARDFALKSLDLMALASTCERLDVRGQLPRPAAPPGGVVGGTRGSFAALTNGNDPAAVRAPAWATSAGAQLGRGLTAPWLLPLFLSPFARLAVTGLDALAAVKPPYILAVLPHEHGGDVLAVYAALPASLRARLMFIGAAWTFREPFEPGTPWGRRILIGAAVRGLIPALLPFVLVPRTGSVGEALTEAGRLIELGFNPVMFPQGDRTGPKGPTAVYKIRPGLGHIAAATGAAVIPVCLSGNERFTFSLRPRRRRITVHFGQPVRPSPGATPDEVTRAVEEALRRLRQSAADGPQ